MRGLRHGLNKPAMTSAALIAAMPLVLYAMCRKMTFNESCALDLPVSQVAAPRTLKLRARAYTPCMGNLEKLCWIDAFAVTGYGVRVGVRVNDAALIERLRSRLPPGAKISPMGTVFRSEAPGPRKRGTLPPPQSPRRLRR